MARTKENISVSLDKDVINKIDRLISFGNRSRYISEAVQLRLSEIKLEKIDIIKKYLEDNPNKIGDFILYENALARMLKVIE